MIDKFDIFLLEKVGSKAKSPEFWSDYNEMLKTILSSNNHSSFEDFHIKYKDVLNDSKLDAIHDKLANMHNTNRIPSKISFGEWCKMWSFGIPDIYKYYLKLDPTLAEKLRNNPVKFMKTIPVKIYRGIPINSKENKDFLDLHTSRSFTLDINRALSFTQIDWLSRGYKNDANRNGYIFETEIKLNDIDIFSNLGDELECIVTGGLRYTKTHIVKNGKIVE